MTPAEEHRWVSGEFTRRVEGVRPEGWDAPSPVREWKSRDVVRHLIEWSAAFLKNGAAVDLTSGPSVDDDPAGAWRHHRDSVQGLLEDPSSASQNFSNPHIGEMPLDQAIDQFYTPDVFMHTWDLARATGQDDSLDPERCARLLGGMEPMEDVIRASGQYGPRVEVPADADVQVKLLGFIGRDPFWVRSGASLGE